MLSGAAGLTVLILWLGSTFGTSFLPEFNEGTFTVGLFAPPGTSLQASDRMASAIEHQLLDSPHGRGQRERPLVEASLQERLIAHRFGRQPRGLDFEPHSAFIAR